MCRVSEMNGPCHAATGAVPQVDYTSRLTRQRRIGEKTWYCMKKCESCPPGPCANSHAYSAVEKKTLAPAETCDEPENQDR